MVDFEDIRQRAMRAQRRGTHGTAAKDIMLLLAVLCLCASGAYWWRVQSSLVSDLVIAGTFTAILTIAPPVLLSFCIPWSPGGMLLQKVNARTWGMMAVIGAAIYLLYYSFQLQWAWWSGQPVVAESGLIYQQVFVGLIGYILIPALLWTPVSSEELEEKLKQAHLVKRYELQTQADIAILQTTLLRAQQKALVGFANLTMGDRQELAAVLRGLVAGLDRTTQEIAGNLNNSVKTVYGKQVGGVFGVPPLTDDLVDILDYVAQALEGSHMQGPDVGPRAVIAARADLPQQPAVDQRSAPAAAEVGEVISDQLRSAEITPDHPRYLIAQEALGAAVWTDDELARALNLAHNTARKIRAAWTAAGVVISGGSQGRWKFVEEVRP